jgi:hypothetical protein
MLMLSLVIIATERPVPILDFLSDDQIWRMLRHADPAVPGLYRLAWLSRCPDWPAILD